MAGGIQGGGSGRQVAVISDNTPGTYGGSAGIGLALPPSTR